MAYASKYYDPVKAHEYYEKYRKKGLLKGRGKGGTTDAEALRKRRSTASLTDEGKDLATIVKAQIQDEYKAALKKIPRKDKARREALKAEYQERYLQELDKIKGDGSYNKPQKVKKTKSSGGGSSRSSDSGKDEAKKAADKKKKKKRKAAIKRLKNEITKMRDAISELSPRKKEIAQNTIQNMLKRLKALRN